MPAVSTRALLLNTNFNKPSALYPVDRGSRPKGWRASPILGEGTHGFGVRLRAENSAGDSRGDSPHACLGLAGLKSPASLQKGERAILAQEMRNPRAGRFTFAIEACLHASSRELCDFFTKQFTCRLTLYRFADADKNPLRRHELGSLTIQPPAVVGDRLRWTQFELSQILDRYEGPDKNFSIGRGLGVAVEVEKTAEGMLESSPAMGTKGEGWACLCIRSAKLRFTSHTVDDKVVV